MILSICNVDVIIVVLVVGVLVGVVASFLRRRLLLKATTTTSIGTTSSTSSSVSKPPITSFLDQIQYLLTSWTNTSALLCLHYSEFSFYGGDHNKLLGELICWYYICHLFPTLHSDF